MIDGMYKIGFEALGQGGLGSGTHTGPQPTQRPTLTIGRNRDRNPIAIAIDLCGFAILTGANSGRDLISITTYVVMSQKCGRIENECRHNWTRNLDCTRDWGLYDVVKAFFK